MKTYYAVNKTGGRVLLDSGKEYLPGEIDKMFKDAGIDIAIGDRRVKGFDNDSA